MSTQKAKFELFARLQALGFTYNEAVSLRRIEMTLQRWAEAECGDEHGNAIERGEGKDILLINWPNAQGKVWMVESRVTGLTPIREFETNDINDRIAQRALRKEKAMNIPGKPYRTYDIGDNGKRGRHPIADREAGALRRLAAIIKARNERHRGTFVHAYHQGDCRGCMLYLVTDDQLAGRPIESAYTNGLAVCC